MKKVNLKKKIILSIALVFLGMMGFGQSLLQQDTNYNWRTEINNPNADFKKIKQKAQSYFNNHPELDTTRGSGYKLYQRWKGFWNDRTTKTSDTNASFKYLTEAMNHYLQNKQQFSSASDQSNWKLLGPTNDILKNNGSPERMGLVTSIWADPFNVNFILIGTNASGLWKTIDKGQHWVNITDSYGIMNIGVEAIAVDPTNTNKIFIATGFENGLIGSCYDMGILKTSDGGQTWQQTSVTSINPQNGFSFVKKIIMHPDYPNTNKMYFAYGSNVYRTTDGFATKEIIYNGSLFFPSSEINKIRVFDIEMPPGTGNDDKLLISTSGSVISTGSITSYIPAKIFLSENINETSNANVNWSELPYFSGTIAPYVSFIKLTKNNHFNGKVFIAYETIDINGSEIIKVNFYPGMLPVLSCNDGNNNVIQWDEYCNEFVIMPSPYSNHITSAQYATAFLGGRNLKSIYKDDANNNHERIFTRNEIHDDLRALIVNKTSNNFKIFAGSDGGIDISEDNGTTFTSINGENLAISQFYGLGNYETNENDIIAGGVQDNGFWFFKDNLWKNELFGIIAGGDGVDAFFNDKNPSNIFLSSFCSNTLQQSNNYNYNIPPNALNYIPYTDDVYTIRDQPLVFDPINPNTAYNGRKDIYKTTDNGSNFFKISNFATDFPGTNGKIRRIAVAPSNPQYIYVSFESHSWGVSPPSKLLFMTNNGGVSWKDITQNIGSYIHWNAITSLAVSETNPKQIWLTFNGFSNNNSNPNGRVLMTNDADATNIIWTDVSSGLPNFPVNCIRTLKGNSQNELFLANDMGVFYHNDNMTGNYWQPFRNTMPACIVTDIEFNYRKNKIRVSTFGRGIWESDLPCQYESNTMIINNNTTWEAPKRIYKTIEVEPNAVLTIKSIVNMSSQAKIIVKPGAQLILDGCVLNSACPGQLWKGIEVWGDYTRSQMPISNQGYASLRNGATIKDAEIGIQTISVSNNKVRGSGIIQAENAKFIDNKIAVKMLPYQNFIASNPAILKNDLSYFRFCNFETKGKLKDANVSFDAFVDLYNVNGIPFTSCTFVNPLEATNAFTGTGIRSSNSSFRVNAECSQPVAQGSLCPEQYIVRSQFKNLQYGIKVNNYNSGKIVTITESNFENNERGVYLNAAKQAYITRNTVKVKDFHMPQTFVPYGMYLDFSTGYIFEGNSFDKASASNQGTVGLIINNSGADQNMIYNNSFSNLYCATDAQNINRSSSGSIDQASSGLKIKCNDYSGNNNFDIGITPNGCNGISGSQGLLSVIDPTMPAGNSFSVNAYQLNNGGEFFNYFHHANNVSNLILIPTIISGNITLKPTIPSYANKATSCPPQALALSNQGSLSADIIANTQQLNSAKLMLTIWVDGGNTPALKEAVNLSYSWEAFELYNNLIGKSPYLSDEVMIDAIKREDVLPALMLKYILLANPQAVKSQKVMDALYHRNDPFPDAWLDELKQGADIVSPREQLEAQVSYYAQQRQLAVNELKYMYLSDSIAQYPTDSLIALLSTDIEATSEYQLAEYYLMKGDFSTCDNILENIPAKYAYREEEQNNYLDYRAYIDILKDIVYKDKDLTELNEDQRNKLNYLAETNQGFVSAYARSILSIVDERYNYEEPVFLPDGENPRKMAKPKNKQILKAENLLQAFPNPANEFIIVEFNITDKVNNPRLEIIDAIGRKVQTIELQTAKGQKMFQTQEMAKGLYHCYLINDNKIIRQVKISKE